MNNKGLLSLLNKSISYSGVSEHVSGLTRVKLELLQGNGTPNLSQIVSCCQNTFAPCNKSQIFH